MTGRADLLDLTTATRPDALTDEEREGSCRLGPGQDELAGKLPVAEAAHDVVVDESRRLHERVADRRADEAEAAALQVLAHRARLGRLGGDLGQRLPAPDDRLAADEVPPVVREAAA